MAASKFRIRFRKAGDLRFLSHHDLMRAFERMLRRAQLPFRSTEGFHPKPKMAFASALALGIVGLQEVIEIEFEEELAAEDVHARLSDKTLPGLTILQVRRIELRRKAMVTRAGYRIGLMTDDDLPHRAQNLLAQSEIWMQRDKPQPRRVDIRPYLQRLAVEDAGLLMEFTVTPNGTARPEEILRLLGLEKLLHNGGVLERVLLEIQDEIASVVGEPSEGSSEREGAIEREAVSGCARLVTDNGRLTTDQSKGHS
jgi:radical SAM-linked protein